MDIESTLKKLRDYEREQNKLKGQIEGLHAQLKSEFGFNSFDDAVKALNEMKKEARQYEIELDESSTLLDKKCEALQAAGIKL